MATQPTKRLFCFGFGYVARYLQTILPASWEVVGTSSTSAPGIVSFDDEANIAALLRTSDAVLISTPPTAQGDPVLARYAHLLKIMGPTTWIGYLSATSVYGDHKGAWVDELSATNPTSPNGIARLEAEKAYQTQLASHNLHIFRLSGIYGPERSIVDQVLAGTAKWIDAPNHCLSRIHVHDIAQTFMQSMARPNKGATYNLADDMPCPTSDLIRYVCDVKGLPYPPALPLDHPSLSPMLRGFYTDQKRVCNKRIKNELSVKLRFPTYKEGLDALLSSKTIR